jgi:hypothetical protein
MYISIGPIMRNVSDKSCRENQQLFFFENRAVCEIMWKNIVQPDMIQVTIRRKRVACWITKAKDAYSEYVILNDLPLQQ